MASALARSVVVGWLSHPRARPALPCPKQPFFAESLRWMHVGPLCSGPPVHRSGSGQAQSARQRHFPSHSLFHSGRRPANGWAETVIFDLALAAGLHARSGWAGLGCWVGWLVPAPVRPEALTAHLHPCQARGVRLGWAASGRFRCDLCQAASGSGSFVVGVHVPSLVSQLWPVLIHPGPPHLLHPPAQAREPVDPHRSACARARTGTCTFGD